MKRTMPLVTLLSGATVGAAVLVASMLSTSTAPPVRNAAAASPASGATVVTLPSPGSAGTIVALPPPASSVTAAQTAAPGSTPTYAPATAPSTTPVTTPAAPPTTAKATPTAAPPTRDEDYAGQVDGGGASVAISIRGGQAIAYVSDGYGTIASLAGTAAAGQLYLTGQNGARLKAAYDTAQAVGYVITGGVRYTFSIPAVRSSADL